MLLLYCGVYDETWIVNTTDRTIATRPTIPARAAPHAASSRIGASAGAKYRDTNAGVICDASHATSSVATGSTISAHMNVASRVRR